VEGSQVNRAPLEQHSILKAHLYATMAPNKPPVAYNDSTSSIDFLAGSFEEAPMSTPHKLTQRTTLKPASAQSLKFHDLVLSSPSRQPSRKGQSSPTKLNTQAESPWRIRVTVEAEREDGSEGGGTRTKTTKVPLKPAINEDTAPKKSRGRTRKSEAGSPASRKRSGTPKPKNGRRKSCDVLGGNEGETDKENEGSGPRRPVGRPRKSLTATQGTSKHTGSIVSGLVNDVPASEIPKTASGCRPRKGPSPFQFSVDPEDDVVGIVSNDDPPSSGSILERQHLTVAAVNRIPKAPVQEAQEKLMVNSMKVRTAEEEEARFTPVEKTPTKAKEEKPRDRVARHLNAGRTPRKSSSLPTPSSSILEADPVNEPSKTTDAIFLNTEDMERGQLDSQSPSPHREFDTILESEGFSMVSLDSVPSAKPHLSSPLAVLDPIPSSKKSSLPPKPLPTRVLQIASAHVQIPSSPPAHTYADISSLREETPSLLDSTPKLPTLKPARPTLEKKSTPRLAKVVRAGIALQGVLDTRKKTSALGSPFSSPEKVGSGSSATGSQRERLENLFRGFGPETQRELRAGLRFGEELAKRQREAEKQQKALCPTVQTQYSRDEAIDYPVLPPPQNQQQLPSPVTDNGYDEMSWTYDTPDTRHRKELQAEWQREREAVSRQIQEANTSQVIVINSDDLTPSHLYREFEEGESDHPELDLQQQLQNDAGQYEGDIWQQEAFSSDPQEEEERDEPVPDQLPRPRRAKIPSPWRRGEDVPASDDMTEDFTGIFNPAGESALLAPPNSCAQRMKASDNPLDFSALLDPKDGKDDPSWLFKPDETAQSQSQSRVIEDKTSTTLHPSEGEEAYSYEIEVEQSLRSVESGIDSPILMGSKLKTPTEPRQDHVEVPVMREVKNVTKEVSTEKPLTVLQELSIRETRIAPETDGNSTAEVEEDNSSKEANQQSWFGLITSYLAPWRSSKPSEAVQTAPLPPATYEYPKAHFTNLPPHGLPHPTTPLPTRGDWTNYHYKYLLLLHNHSLVHPEDFPLPPAADKSLVGEIMEAGGYTRPITELQLAICEMWKSTISKGNEELGWSGEIEWDDWFIIKGLFSVEIGQVNRREARRIKLLEEQEKEKQKQQKEKEKVAAGSMSAVKRQEMRK
jgi:hypothetical protein